MNSNFDIEILNNLGTLNSFDFTTLKLIVDPEFHLNNNLYIFFPGQRRINLYKLLLNPISIKENTKSSSQFAFLKFQQSFHYTITLLDVTKSKNDVWAVASKGFLPIRNFLKNKNLVDSDECMESSIKDEYPFYGYQTVVNTSHFQEHSFHGNFFCFKSDLFENSILICYENTELSLWQIVLVISSTIPLENNLECIQLFSFSSSYSRESNKRKVWKPEVLFFDTEHPILKNICDSKTRCLSNYACLIGQPDGTIVYSLCSWNCQRKEFKQITPLQNFHILEEPILSISIQEIVGELLRLNVMIIIGEKGKLILVSSEKLCNDAVSSQLVNGLWIMSWRLPSSVKSFIILNDCIIFCSFQGEVWIAKIHGSDSQENNDVNQCIRVATRASDFKNVCSLSLINKDEGIFIMLSNTGSMYLMRYSEKTSIVNNKSLPILMNTILEQSLLLKDLVSMKHLQSRLFAALSTFANIKFGATKELDLICKVTEVEDASKKLLITINLDGLQFLNLDTEFWMISGSVFSHFQMDSASITKCSPLVLGSTLQLEVLESNFCLSYSCPFPLYIEVGLILRLPMNYMSHDCFQDILKKLPLYVKTNTAILTELYLLKNRNKMLTNPKFSKNTKSGSVLYKISDSYTENPLYKMLDCVPETFISIFNTYTHCLLESTAEEFVKNIINDSSLEKTIFHAVLERSFLPKDCDGNNLQCQDQPLSLSVFKQDKKVNIDISSESLTVLGLKTAIAELILSKQSTSICDATNCVSISASVLKKCEELSKELRNMYGQDVKADNFLENIFKVYCKLRKEVSEKMPL